MGTLSLEQKGQTSGCSGKVVYGGGDIIFGPKMSNQRTQVMQYAVDTVCGGHSGCSGLVVCSIWDIVFGVKRSKQWILWMQWYSGIW